MRGECESVIRTFFGEEPSRSRRSEEYDRSRECYLEQVESSGKQPSRENVVSTMLNSQA